MSLRCIQIALALAVCLTSYAHAQGTSEHQDLPIVRGTDPRADPRLVRWEHHCVGVSGILVIEAWADWRKRQGKLTQLRFNAVAVSPEALARINAAIPANSVIIDSVAACAPDHHQVLMRYRRLGAAYATGLILFALRDDASLIDNDVVTGEPKESSGP